MLPPHLQFTELAFRAAKLRRQMGARLRNTLREGTHLLGARLEAPPPELGVDLSRRRDYIPEPYFLMSQMAMAAARAIQIQQPKGILDVIFKGF